MTNITLKLFGPLKSYLPEETRRNTAEMTLDDGTTVGGLIDAMKLPKESCHLVVVNGVFVPPQDRHGHDLTEGDTLAIWPPVAGG